MAGGAQLQGGISLKKRTFVLGIIITALVFAAGCGKAGGKDSQTSAASKNYVYSTKDLSFEGAKASISQLMSAGNQVYAYGYGWNESSGNEEGNTSFMEIYSLAEDGTPQEKKVINLEVNQSLNSLNADAEGNFYAIKNVYQASEEDPENYQDLYYLVKYSPECQEIFSVNLQDIPEIAKLNTEGYFYAGPLLMGETGTIYVSVVGRYVKFDSEGNFKGIVGEGPENQLEGVSLIKLKDNRIAGIFYEDTGTTAGFVDMEKGTIGEKTKVPGVSYEYSFYPGIGYDLYLANNYGVFGYNIGDEDKTQLLSYIDSDFGVYGVYGITPINEKSFFGIYDSTEDKGGNGSVVSIFTKVEPEDVKDKTILTLACENLDWNVRNNVIKFNKANENYRIVIQDYNSLYGSETDYNAGVNKLNTDIASGKIPDILLISDRMPIESYITKGLFEDIKPYIEKDAELDINNFMPNVIDAFSVDGKLYRLTPNYMISTMAAKASDVGEERGWTVQEAMDILAAKPEGTQFIANATRDDIMYNFMSMAGNQFIDWTNGVCSFDSEGFIQLLEFARLFPEEIKESDYGENYWNDYETFWREGKVLAQMVTIASIRDYNYLEKGTFGEKITMIGFPSDNEDGSAINASIQFAMSAKSKNKEGVWEFLRYFLTDEYQKDQGYGLPLSIKRLEEMTAEAMKRPTYEDENGNLVEYDDTYYMGGIEVPISPMTAEEAEEFKETLYSFHQVYTYDETLLNIINEEAAAYFKGQKKAEDVAKIVQSRAEIYVNENR